MVTPSNSFYNSTDCSEIKITDNSTYTLPSIKANTGNRNWYVTDGCTGEVLSTGGQAEIGCFAISVQPVAGEVYQITFGGISGSPVSVSYTVLAQDLVVSGPDVTAAEALQETSKNIFAKLYAQLQDKLADSEYVTFSLATCNCLLQAQSKLPGVPLNISVAVTPFSGSSPSFAYSITQVSKSNKRYSRSYTYTFANPSVTLTSLSAWGQNVLPSSISAGTIAALAAALNNLSLGLGIWTSTSSTLSIISTSPLGNAVGTVGGSPATVVPVGTYAPQTADDELLLAENTDRVVCVRQSVEEVSPQYVESYFTLDAGYDSTTRFTIQIANIVPNPLQFAYFTSNALTGDNIVQQFNEFVVEVMGISNQDVYAYRSTNRISIRVSSAWLTQQGLTTGSIVFSSSILSGAGALGAVLLNWSTVVPAVSTWYEASTCAALLCKSLKEFSRSVFKESDSCYQEDACLPKSTLIDLTLTAIDQQVCQGNYCDASRLIQSIAPTKNCKHC